MLMSPVATNLFLASVQNTVLPLAIISPLPVYFNVALLCNTMVVLVIFVVLSYSKVEPPCTKIVAPSIVLPAKLRLLLLVIA